MKKEQKRNLLLASVTALLLLIIYIMMPSGAVGKPEEGITVYSMDADTVTGLSFESSGGRRAAFSLSLARRAPSFIKSAMASVSV